MSAAAGAGAEAAAELAATAGASAAEVAAAGAAADFAACSSAVTAAGGMGAEAAATGAAAAGGAEVAAAGTAGAATAATAAEAVAMGEVALNFGLSGFSNMAASAVTNPIDVVKVKLQLDKSKGSVMQRCWRMVREEGMTGLFSRGLVASMVREGVYGTIRLGAYDSIKNQLHSYGVKEDWLGAKVLAAGTAGAIGSAVGAPTELVKVKMQATGWTKSEKPFSSTLCCWRRVARTEGLKGLFCGSKAFVVRSSVLTGAQIPSYEVSKHWLKEEAQFSEGTALHLTASMAAGFVATAACSPFDFIKTRMMNEGAKYDYNTLKCLTQSVRAEGPLSLYNGAFANWMRLGPHTIVTFLVYERAREFMGVVPM